MDKIKTLASKLPYISDSLIHNLNIVEKESKRITSAIAYYNLMEALKQIYVDLETLKKMAEEAEDEVDECAQNVAVESGW